MPTDSLIRVRPAEESDREEWDRLVQRHERGTIYHRFLWRDLVSRVFGHQTFYLLASDDKGHARGLFPLVRLKSLLFGDFLISVPFVNYGGPIADSAAVENQLLGHAAGLARDLGVDHIESRDCIPRDIGWQARTDKVIMELALPESSDRLHKALSSKVRSQIKRPLREGAQSTVGGVELLPEFYRVFARNMRDLGTPVYSRRFFATIFDSFPQTASLIVIRIGGDAVAAGLLLGDKHRLEIPWASSIREYNRIGVNMLLYWGALEFAIGEGYATFDFGRSSTGSGTHRFKKQWGPSEKQLYWHYWLPSRCELPMLNASNPKFRLAIGVWQRLPLFLANAIGPGIVRNLP